MALRGVQPGTDKPLKREGGNGGENRREATRQREVNAVNEALKKGYINDNVRNFFEK